MVTQWGGLGQPRVPPGTALRNEAVPGRRGWGRSPGPPGGTPTQALLLSPSLGAPTPPHAGCQALSAQWIEGPARAPPGTSATKLLFFPRQLLPWPRRGGTRGWRPRTGTGTHALPRRSPRGMRGRFRRRSRHGGRQDGRGPRGLTSPLRPMSPQRHAVPQPGPRTAMNSWPRNAHTAVAKPLPENSPLLTQGPATHCPAVGQVGGTEPALCTPRGAAWGIAPIPASPGGAGQLGALGGAHLTPPALGTEP